MSSDLVESDYNLFANVIEGSWRAYANNSRTRVVLALLRRSASTIPSKLAAGGVELLAGMLGEDKLDGIAFDLLKSPFSD